jgi:ribosomal protein L18E
MSFSVGTLAAYTKENEQLLVASSVLGSKTAGLIKDQGNVMVGVKSAETINIMDTDAIFQDGSSCGFNASGLTSFTQRTVTVGKIKVNEALCLKDLESKYLQKALPAGSMYTSMIYSEEYSNRKAEKIAEQLEKALWQGNTSSVDVNLNKFDGLLKLITAAGASVVNANSVAFHGSVETSITASNVISIFDDIYKAIPAQVVDKDDMAIFCGMDVFRTYTVALKTANQFHYTVDQKANGEFVLPGTTIRVIAVQGLNGTGDIVAARISNFFLGTDLLNEEERFEIFYATEAMQMRFVAEFKMGVNFAFPDEIVKFFV